MKSSFLNSGVKLRWINTAGFEIIMSNGKHILLDPFLSGTVDGIECHPMALEEIDQCDYLLLSHIHIDHAADVARIQKKFPELRLFVGDLSADPLCTVQNVDCSRMYRVRPGSKFEFDDITIKVFAGRHTESTRGYFRTAPKYTAADGALSYENWFGNLELQNYLITTCDGTKILIWAGMTSEDQMHLFAGLNPDLSLMHVSPKQDFESFAKLTSAINAQVIIPHHYDFTECLFEVKPEMMLQMSEENRKNFIVNEKFNFARYMEALETACRRVNQSAALLMLEHHRWYHFGLAYSLIDENLR